MSIPEGIETIGSNSFGDCENLTDISLPSSLREIGSFAFNDTAVEKIIIPDGVETIKSDAFNGCSNLSKVTIPDSVTTIEGGAFRDCDKLTTAGPVGGNYNVELGYTQSIPIKFNGFENLYSVTIPDGVTSIVENAFYSGSIYHVSKIIVPESLTEIGENAFASNGITSAGPVGGNYDLIFHWKNEIPNYAFSGCENLKNIVIPESVTKIGDYAFSGCAGLNSFTIPSQITQIGQYAFYDNENLTSVSIPSGITRIESGTFMNCNNLTSVLIPDTVTYIADNAFYSCPNLVIYCNDNSSAQEFAKDQYPDIPCKPISEFPGAGTIDGIITEGAYHIRNNGDGTGTLVQFTDTDYSGILEIPDTIAGLTITGIDGTVYVGEDNDTTGFYGCNSLTGIVLPQTITKIAGSGMTTFNCVNLSAVAVPKGVNEIDTDVFDSGYDSLTVYGYSGSYIEQYAKENNVPFLPISEFPGGNPWGDAAVLQWFGFALSNTINSVVTDIGTFSLEENSGIALTENGLKGQFIYCTLNDKNQIVTLKVINPQSGILTGYDPSARTLTIDTGNSSGSYTLADGADESFLSAGVDRVPVRFFALDNIVYSVQNAETIIGIVNTLMLDTDEPTAQIGSTSYPVANDNSVKLALQNAANSKAVVVLYEGVIGYAVKVSDISSLIATIQISPDIITYQNGSYDNSKLTANIRISATSSLPIDVDLSALEGDDDFGVMLENVEVKLLWKYTDATAEEIFHFGDDYESSSGAEYKIPISNEQSILYPGQALTETIPISVNSDYAPDDVTAKLITAALTVNGTSLSGEQITQTVETTIRAKYPENVVKPEETPEIDSESQNSIENAAQKAAERLDSIEYTGSSQGQQKKSSVVSWHIEMNNILTQKQQEQIGKALLSYIILSNIPEQTLKEYLEEEIVQYLIGDYIPPVGTETLDYVMDVAVNNSEYGPLRIRFTCEGASYNLNGSPFAGLGTIQYEIIGGKGLNNVPAELRASGGVRSRMPFAGIMTEGDIKAFSTAAYDLAEKELSGIYDEVYGNDFDDAVELIFGKTINDILEKTESGSASGLLFDIITKPAKTVRIACPVDVYVYSSDDLLKGAFIDNEITENDEKLNLYMDGDAKVIEMWSDDYTIKIVATDTGSMNIIVEEYAGGNRLLREVHLNDVPLTSDKIYTASISQDILLDGNLYKLTDESDSETLPDSDTIYIKSDTSGSPSDDNDSSSQGGGNGGSGGSGSSSSRNQINLPNNVENGSISISNTSASKGDLVTITVKPDTGYDIDTVTVTDKNGNQLRLTEKGNGKYTFVMPGSRVFIEATFKKSENSETDSEFINPFYDVSEENWFYQAVKYVYQNGLMSGTSKTMFSPNQNMTRGMVVTVLYRMENQPDISTLNPFIDVEQDKYYHNAVIWASENSIISGYGNGTFGPDDNITREQFVSILYRYAKYIGMDTKQSADMEKLSYYKDADEISSYALEPFYWAITNRMINGTSESELSPKEFATRAQVAEIIMGFANFN